MPQETGGCFPGTLVQSRSGFICVQELIESIEAAWLEGHPKAGIRVVVPVNRASLDTVAPCRIVFRCF